MSVMFPHWIKDELPDILVSDFIKTSLGNIHYLHGGNGDPVLFLHGNPTWGFLWRKVIHQLPPDQYTFYAPDLLNLGFSDSLDSSDFTLANHSRAIQEFVSDLDLKRITLVVQDWGGPIGLHAASCFPERIKKLVILNTGVTIPRPPYDLSRFHKLTRGRILPHILFNIFRLPLYSLGKVQADPNSISGNVARAYRYPIRLKKRWDSPLRFARMITLREEDPATEIMGEVEKFVFDFPGPVEIVWGTNDPILGRRLKSVEEAIPGARVRRTEAGHFLQEECPEVIAAAIQSS